MTKRGLERILRVWQERLQLQNYRVELIFDPDHELSDGKKVGSDYASIKIADDYEEATIVVNPEWSTWTQEEANEVLVHELVHIFENGCGITVESLEPFFDETAYKLIESRYNHEVELMVERLARVLIAIGGAEDLVRRGFQIADFQIRHEPLWRRIVRRFRR